MASPVITPNMGLTEPAIGSTLSPGWAMLLNADIGILDQHNHTQGQGIQIPPSGLNINSNLTMQGNSLTSINSLIFQGALTGSGNVLSVYTNGTDLFYEDIHGNSIQLTKAGGPNAGTGNIQNLPSTPTGGAGISWVNGQSTFQFLTDAGTTGANIDVGSAVLRYPGSYPTPSGTNYISLEVPSSISAGYALTLPPAPPSVASFLQMSTSGVVTAAPALLGALTGANFATNLTLAGSLTTGDFLDVPNTIFLGSGSSGATRQITIQPNDGALLVPNIQLGSASGPFLGNTTSNNVLIINTGGATRSIITNQSTLSSSYPAQGILYGTVNLSGSITSGVGFICTRTAAGTYSISFVNGFSISPTPVITQDGFASGGVSAIAVITGLSSTGFTVNMSAAGGGGNIDAGFTFVVLGFV